MRRFTLFKYSLNQVKELKSTIWWEAILNWGHTFHEKSSYSKYWYSVFALLYISDLMTTI